MLFQYCRPSVHVSNCSCHHTSWIIDHLTFMQTQRPHSHYIVVEYSTLLTRKSCTRRYRRVLCASAAMVWPWTLTFWSQNLISSSLSREAPVTKVWRKSVNRYWRYRRNIKLPRESRTDGRTHGRTHGQRHARTTRKHIASAGAYRRRRLNN